MFVEETEENRFAVKELTQNELEIISEALVLYKHKLDSEEFRDVRRSCVEMFQKIELELVKSKA